MRRLVLRLLVCALSALAVLTACSSHSDYYRRRPYADNGRIVAGLAVAQHSMSRLLSHGDTQSILAQRTAAPWNKRMRRFLAAYAGHPTRFVASEPVGEDPDISGESLLVACAPDRAQRVGLTWGWFDGAWRAWPEYDLFPLNRCGR